MEGPVSVLVVAEDLLARSGLATIVERDRALAVAARAASTEDLAAIASSHSAAIVLWDLGTDPRTGVDRLREVALDLPIVVLLTDPSLAAEAYSLGARGLLLRGSDPDRIPAAIVAVTGGLVAVGEGIEIFAARRSDPRIAAASETLTRRELEVLELLSEGLSNKAIAERLAISEHTAKFHVNAILTKLGAETRTEAVVLAARLGLVVL